MVRCQAGSLLLKREIPFITLPNLPFTPLFLPLRGQGKWDRDWLKLG